MWCLVWLAVASVASVVMMRNYSVVIMRTEKRRTPQDNNRNDRMRLVNRVCFHRSSTFIYLNCHLNKYNSDQLSIWHSNSLEDILSYECSRRAVVLLNGRLQSNLAVFRVKTCKQRVWRQPLSTMWACTTFLQTSQSASQKSVEERRVWRQQK